MPARRHSRGLGGQSPARDSASNAHQKYAEGGQLVTIQTFIGPQTQLTDATVTFGYSIEQKTWSDVTPATVKELVP
jgi:hypothetical protein